jgi:hypothetical protein
MDASGCMQVLACSHLHRLKAQVAGLTGWSQAGHLQLGPSRMRSKRVSLPWLTITYCPHALQSSLMQIHVFEVRGGARCQVGLRFSNVLKQAIISASGAGLSAGASGKAPTLDAETRPRQPPLWRRGGCGRQLDVLDGRLPLGEVGKGHGAAAAAAAQPQHQGQRGVVLDAVTGDGPLVLQLPFAPNQPLLVRRNALCVRWARLG